MTIAVNLGGLSGGQIFNAKYAPSYHYSIRTITIIGAAAWVVAAALIGVYYLDRRSDTVIIGRAQSGGGETHGEQEQKSG